MEQEQKEKLYHKHVVRNYAIMAGVVIAFSFLGFIWNEWVTPICVTICSFFGLLVALLLMKTHSDVDSDAGKGSFVIYLLLRFLCMAVGITLAAVLVMATMGEEKEKLRYVIVLIAALPYFLPTVSILITNQVK